MSHFFQITLYPIFLSFIFFNAALVLGTAVLYVLGFRSGISRQNESRSIVALCGFGALGYVSLIISAFGSISKTLVFFTIGGLILLGRKMLWNNYTYWRKNAKQTRTGWTFFEKSLFFLILCGITFYLMSALVPPYRTDALAYHIPEAVSIAETGFHPPINGSLFYGNLPVLMETLYAFAYKMGGFTLIHLTHFQILLIALVALYTFVKQEFSSRAGLFSVLLIFTLYELFVNATNSYIDAAQTSFEIIGLLSLVRWILKKDTVYLRLAGALYGFSMAIKYNALYGVLIAGVIMLVSVINTQKDWKGRLMSALNFTIPLLLFCSFWYIKNAVMYHNPVFPFYFGHPGYTDAGYLDLVQTINLYEMDRTIINFFRIPFHFFTSPYYAVVFLATMLWPAVHLVIRRVRQCTIIKIFSVYVFLYTIIWFFFATHQLKFFFVPMVLWLTLFGLFIDYTYELVIHRSTPTLKRFSLVTVICAGILFFTGVVNAKNNYFVNVKRAEIRYIVGFDSELDFYHRKSMGYAYEMSEYINTHFQDIHFFNVWNTPDYFLKRPFSQKTPHELYYSKAELTKESFATYLKEQNLPYILVDEYEKSQSYTESVRVNNPASVAYRGTPEAIDTFVPSIADLVYSAGSIRLYKLKQK